MVSSVYSFIDLKSICIICTEFEIVGLRSQFKKLVIVLFLRKRWVGRDLKKNNFYRRIVNGENKGTGIYYMIKKSG